MKKYFFLLVIIQIFFSCGKDEKSPCEENDWGTVTVNNQSIYPIWVNIWSDTPWGDWRGKDTYLTPGESVTFSEVKMGEMYHLVSVANDDWTWNSNRKTLFSCEVEEWSWTNEKLYDVFSNNNYNWDYFKE